jgi:acyl dehydratase
MTIDPSKLLARAFAPIEQRYVAKDTILYALGVGFGADPVDPDQLRFVYEQDLRAVPTMANILGYPGFWAREPDTGIDWRRVVHAEQSIVLHKPLAPEGHIRATTTVSGLWDRGPERGAFLEQTREIVDLADGTPIATVKQLSLLRGDGGCGGSAGAPPPPHEMPDRAPDTVCDIATPPQAALLYRLNGDLNPLHADPVTASAAGFERPILHGLSTMGFVCHAAMQGMLGYAPEALAGIRVRFTAPVIPGDVVRTELWRDGTVISMRATVPARDVVVIKGGRIDLKTS